MHPPPQPLARRMSQCRKTTARLSRPLFPVIMSWSKRGCDRRDVERRDMTCALPFNFGETMNALSKDESSTVSPPPKKFAVDESGCVKDELTAVHRPPTVARPSILETVGTFKPFPFGE